MFGVRKNALLAACAIFIGCASLNVAGLMAATPDSWTRVDGRAVRMLTDDEAEQLGVAYPSWLVKDPSAIRAIGQGSRFASVLIPLPDGEAIELDLAKVATVEPGVEFVDRHGRNGRAFVRTFVPSFHEYLTPNPVPRPGGIGQQIEGSADLLRVLVQAEEPLSAIAMGALMADDGQRVNMKVVGAEELPPELALPNGKPVFLVTVTPLDPDTRSMQEQCDAGIFAGCNAYCSNVDADASCDSEYVEHPCCDPYDPGGPSIHHECNDGINNDGDPDGLVDLSDPDCQHSIYCDQPGLPLHLHTYEAGATLGLFGDMVQCTKLANQWTTQLWNLAGDLKRVYHTTAGAPSTGNAVFDNWVGFPADNKPLHIGAIGCWRVDSVEDAVECRDFGGAACAPFGVGATHEYPYIAIGPSLSGFAGHVKDDVWHAAMLAGLETPLNIAHVYVNTEEFVMSGAVGYADSIPGFGSASLGISDLWRSAHEVGHTLGMIHCMKQVVDVLPGGALVWSLMGTREQDACTGDVADQDELSAHLATIEAGQVHQTLMDLFDDDLDPMTPDWHILHRSSFGNH